MKVIYISKKDFYIVIIILTLLIAFGFFLFNEYKTEEVSYLPITNRIIGIDPGHGGVDPGAVSKTGVKEDDINLKIALKLKRFIEQSGGIAIMTREEDKGLYTGKSKTLREMKTEDLMSRKKLIVDSDSEIFISIHLNSFTKARYYGAQTFYMKDDKISLDMANIIQGELRNVLDEENRRQPEAREDVYLLKDMTIPTVLVEGGFLSNPLEEKLLITEEYQEKIAWTIYVGIMKYFSTLTGDSNF